MVAVYDLKQDSYHHDGVLFWFSFEKDRAKSIDEDDVCRSVSFMVGL